MSVLPALTEALYREEIARARAMDPSDKLLEGPRLFQRACLVIADGIRHRHPDFSEDEVLAQVKASLSRLRTLDDERR